MFVQLYTTFVFFYKVGLNESTKLLQEQENGYADANPNEAELNLAKRIRDHIKNSL